MYYQDFEDEHSLVMWTSEEKNNSWRGQFVYCFPLTHHPVTLQSKHKELRAAAMAVLANLTARLNLQDSVAQAFFAQLW